jgi:hypothetical protein
LPGTSGSFLPETDDEGGDNEEEEEEEEKEDDGVGIFDEGGGQVMNSWIPASSFVHP